jgi:hypothetical protein
MEALSQLSYGPVRKTLNLKGKPAAMQAAIDVFPSVRGSREYQKSAGCKALAAAGTGGCAPTGRHDATTLPLLISYCASPAQEPVIAGARCSAASMRASVRSRPNKLSVISIGGETAVPVTATRMG